MSTPLPPPPVDEEPRPLPPGARVYWKHNPKLDAELWRRVDAMRVTISRLTTHQGWFVWDIFEWAVVDLCAAKMHFEDIDRKMKEDLMGNLHLNQRATTLHGRIKTDMQILMLTGTKMKSLMGKVNSRKKTVRDATEYRAKEWENMTGQKVEVPVPEEVSPSLAPDEQTKNA